MNPNLPFAIWLAHVDLLSRAAWQVDAYFLGPQPWDEWHAANWTPSRAILELSTPAAPHHIDNNLFTLPPTVTTKFAIKEIIMDTNVLESLENTPVYDSDLEISIDYLHIQNPHQYPVATRQDKITALQRLSITIAEDQTPLQVWLLAMCKKNALPEILPAPAIGEVAVELCPNWLWWLA